MIKCYNTLCQNYKESYTSGFSYADGKHIYWFCSKSCINEALKDLEETKKVLLDMEKALKEAKLNYKGEGNGIKKD